MAENNWEFFFLQRNGFLSILRQNSCQVTDGSVQECVEIFVGAANKQIMTPKSKVIRLLNEEKLDRYKIRRKKSRKALALE